MLKELSKIAVGMLGLQGFPLQPFSTPATSRGTQDHPVAGTAQILASDSVHGPATIPPTRRAIAA